MEEERALAVFENIWTSEGKRNYGEFDETMN